MALRLRLIPVVIVAATVLLGLKVSDIFAVGGAAKAQAPSTSAATGAPVDLTKAANAARKSPTASLQPNPEASADTPPASPSPSANAQPAKPNTPPPANTAANAPATPAAANAPGANTTAANPPAANQAVANQAAAQAAAPASDAKPGTQVADASATAPATGPKPPTKDPLLLSPAEIEILQQLSQRRAEIDQRAGDLNQQQVLLQAAEKRVDEKIAKLQQLQNSIQSSVDKQKADDDARTQSMVKIYETMKPKDAAQILGQMDMPNVLRC